MTSRTRIEGLGRIFEGYNDTRVERTGKQEGECNTFRLQSDGASDGLGVGGKAIRVMDESKRDGNE